jgi:hypothetical protein
VTPSYSFRDRLTLARVMIANGALPLPTHTLDQLDAAGTDTRKLHDRMAAVLPIIEPDRHWQARTDGSPSVDVRATLTAAVLGCDICVHLRKGGPQPSFARLSLKRIDCQRCVQTARRPVTAPDECDVCQSLGIETFFPFGVRMGPTLIAGDACPACAETLGIVMEPASA